MSIDQQEQIRKGILGPQLYKLCKDKKATDDHLEDRAFILSKTIGEKCSKDDIINLCNLSSTSTIDSECSNNFENPLLLKLNDLLEGQVECPICYDDLDETARIIGKCGHIYHENCLNDLIKRRLNKCPLCREPISYKLKVEEEIIKAECKEMFRYSDPMYYTAKAAKEGSMECLKWAFDNGYECNEYTTKYAAMGGHFECLKFAHEKGCPWNEETPALAAENGHLNCLRYSHENGCRWDIRTTLKAARNGHLNCLSYAHENGCPWTEDVVTQAILSGNFDVFKYAVDNECPITSDTLKFLEHQIENNRNPNEVRFRQQCFNYLKSKGWKKGFFSRKWSL
jgi:Ring finger domain